MCAITKEGKENVTKSPYIFEIETGILKEYDHAPAMRLLCAAEPRGALPGCGGLIPIRI